MKKDFKTLEVPHQNLNPLVKFINDKFKQLEDDSNDNQYIVRLKSHKKKALMFALPNLPAATGSAYTTPNDAETTSVPSLKKLLNTYRGDVTETCLNDREELLEKYFEEMYFNGTILESTFDTNKVPQDTDSNDNIILKTNNIASKNQHQAKILSSGKQIEERQRLVNDKRIKEYAIQKNITNLNNRIMH